MIRTGARVAAGPLAAARENEETGRGLRDARLYTPLVPRPEGGASSIMLPRFSETEQAPRTWRADDITPEMVEAYRERFAEYFNRGTDDECWLWFGYTLAGGYGKFLRSSKAVPSGWLAHRMAWVLATGQPLLHQLTIDHLCRVRNCVNPAHLEPVTMAENASRGSRASTGDTCKNGHVGFIYRNGHGHRDCRQCARDRTWRTSNSPAGRARRTGPVECPQCGASVQRKNLSRHRANVHKAA